MQWSFKLGGKETTLTVMEEVAVRPTSSFLETAKPSTLDLSFGDSVGVMSFGAGEVVAQPADQGVFARAGWWFVSPLPAVSFAAEFRTHFSDAETVQQVFLTYANRLLIGTDLATVRVHDTLSEAEVAKVLEEDQLGVVYRLCPAPYTFEVSLPPGRPMPEIINRLQEKTDRYLYAEPSLLQVMTGRQKPNDSYYSYQWHHSNDGSKWGVLGADLHSEGAWRITRGKGKDRPPVRIAIIDNGMQVSHPEFEEGIFGGGYFKGTGDGKASFVPLASGLADFPDGKHGTFCMGMAGARMNNGKGGCGVAPESHLMPISCFDDQTGTQSTLARAINYATEPKCEDIAAGAADGADVISCSLDTGGLLQSGLRDAIQCAKNGRAKLGVPIFWAVSNEYNKISEDLLFSESSVIAVGRSTRKGLSDRSAYGPELDFLAPGTDVFSTRSEGLWDWETGTSFATALAAGVAALVISVNPDLRHDEVRQILRDTCIKLPGLSGHHPKYGYGLLNAEEAVRKAVN